MAYDPNDATDKKLVKKMIDDALAEQATEHETEISGLKDNNKKLLGQVKNQGKEGEEIERLNGEVSTLTTENRGLKRENTKSKNELTDIAAQRDGLISDNRNSRITTGLTEALTVNKVSTPLMDAAKALLRDRVELKTVAGVEGLYVGEKSLGDFTKEWSLGDQGKHFVIANTNKGSGTLPGITGTGDKTAGLSMNRSAYEDMVKNNASAVGKFFSDGGTITDDAT